MDLKTQLLERLDYVNATREARLRMAREVQQHPPWFGTLLEIALGADTPIGSRAAWVVEFVCKQDLSVIFPHLEAFTGGLARLRHESSIRPMAKCCELLAGARAAGGSQCPPFSAGQRERMVAACFDWLIAPGAVAPQAYSMRTLYLLGLEEPWIHEELRALLHRGYPQGSPGYQARARRILKLLEKPR